MLTSKERNDLEINLGHFTGTMEWHKWSMLYPKFLLTDGAQYLAEKASCFWLMDIIGSYQPKLLKDNEWFQVWKLDVAEDKSAIVICEDGNDNKLLDQRMDFTDFPLSEIKLYASWDMEHLVIMLPSEY